MHPTNYPTIIKHEIKPQLQTQYYFINLFTKFNLIELFMNSTCQKLISFYSPGLVKGVTELCEGKQNYRFLFNLSYIT